MSSGRLLGPDVALVVCGLRMTKLGPANRRSRAATPLLQDASLYEWRICQSVDRTRSDLNERSGHEERRLISHDTHVRPRARNRIEPMIGPSDKSRRLDQVAVGSLSRKANSSKVKR